MNDKHPEEDIWMLFKLFCTIAIMVTISLVLTFLSGCSSPPPKGLVGGTAHERGMALQASKDAYNFLHDTGAFPNVKPYSGWRLRLVPVDQSHTFEGHAENTWAVTVGSEKIVYKTPMFGNMMFHEWKHVLLNRAGYVHESHNHDRRAFPEGGVVKR